MSKQQDLLLRKIQSLIGNRTRYIVNYRPKFLKNPFTGKRMEIDIYLPEYRLGIEFQGFHHFTSDVQRRRDELKRELAKKRSRITIVEFFAKDIEHKGIKEIFFERLQTQGYNGKPFERLKAQIESKQRSELR